MDGDNICLGINKNFGFSVEDCMENIWRIVEVVCLYVYSGFIILVFFISFIRVIWKMVVEIIGEKDFLEIFVNVLLEECERCDVKGLY